MKIQKLIAEYRQKIELQDKSIKAEKENRTALRTKLKTVSFAECADAQEDYLESSYKVQKLTAVRQCYVQFISDLESLED